VKVYKFMETKWALKALLEQRIKVSSFGDVNDSFELFAVSLKTKLSREVMRKHVKRLSQTFKFISFCEHWASPLMWGLYGDNHKGIVLEFDIADALLDKVDYIDERLPIDLEKIVSFSDKELCVLTNVMLTTKYADWIYEKEHRMKILQREVYNDNGTDYFDFGSDFKVTAVVRGGRNETSNLDIKKSKSFYHPLKIIQARNAFTSYKIVTRKDVKIIQV
jgi:hypothetical protein